MFIPEGMKRFSVGFLLCASALWLAGCSPAPGGKPTEYETFTRNGQPIKIPKTCTLYYNPQARSIDIKGPSGGYGGVTVNLGEYAIKPNQFQNVSDALVAMDQGRFYTCESMHDAAEANDWARYDRLKNVEDDNTGKMVQIADILAKYPAANKVATPPAPPAKAKTETDELNATLGRWADSYNGKAPTPHTAVARQADLATVLTPRNIMHANAMVGAANPASSPVPAPTVTESKRAKIKAVLAIPLRSDAYFGLKTPTAPPGQQ